MIDIVCSTDGRFIMQTGVMIKSVCMSNPDNDICFHVLIDDTVSSDDKAALKSTIESAKADMEFYRADNILSSYPKIGKVNSYISKATYYRLAIPELLPSLDRVLYLDGDIIVRHSLVEMYNLNLEGISLYAVSEMDEADQPYNRFGYSSDHGYFNAGVLLINLKYWREHDSLNRFLNVINNHADRIVAHDQDTLNIVFNDSWKRMPIKYNLLSGHLYKRESQNPKDRLRYGDEMDKAALDPVVVHFTGPFKPWYQEGKNHPYQKDFAFYLSQTIWKDYSCNKWCPLSLHHYMANILRMLHMKKPLPNPYISI